MLDFYAQRSPIFLAASFDADAAVERGQAIGDGTPVPITIPTSDPGGCFLGTVSLASRPRTGSMPDVSLLLTDRSPTLLPAASG